jgi:hypothetical protein
MWAYVSKFELHCPTDRRIKLSKGALNDKEHFTFGEELLEKLF